MEEANNQIITLNDKVNYLTDELKDANNKLNQANAENDLLNEKVNNLKEQLNVTNKELDDANREINDLKVYIDGLLNKSKVNTTVTVDPVDSSVGSVVKLVAHVADENGTSVSGGKVIFKVNGITLRDDNNNVLYAMLKDGVASINYKVQGVWLKDTSTLQAVYSGNENYTSSRSVPSQILNINRATASITLEKDKITAKSGETLTFRAKILDAAGDRINGGKVVFKLNGKSLSDKEGNILYAGVVDGEALLDYTIPTAYTAKDYVLTAVFGGGDYERSETNVTLTLIKKGVTINTDSITTVNGKTNIKATITDETGALLVSTTKLAFKVNGKTILNGVNSSNGKIDVSFTSTLRPGMYELLIISGENGLYKTGKMTTVLRIEE